MRLYTKQNKHLYTCFVDFSKAFDSIVRQELIQKLSRIGIKSEFLNIIKSIYETTTNLAAPFTSNIGVKQGDTLSTILFNLYINDLPEIFNFDENHPITINNTKISCMIYADDLIIMSTSPNALQQCLNNLETYCKKWKLDVNIKKPKIITFNKQGSLVKKHSYFYKSHTLENVKQYKYLGFIFTCSGSMKHGITNLVKQGKKAWHAIQYYLNISKNKTIHTYLTLFDSKIKPIITYASEAWIDSIHDKKDISNLLTKNTFEVFHISILKQILGVNKKTSNIAVLLELGRCPLTTSITFQAIKYFLRLPSINPCSMLNLLYQEEKHTLTTKTDSYLAFIIERLNLLGMSNIWQEQLLENKSLNSKKIQMTIRRRITDNTSQNLITHMKHQNKKLSFLKDLKDVHQTEYYLNINNFENRRALTKLRTSSHKLKIETGRWQNIERNSRLCQQCPGRFIEDEKHVTFDCTMHLTDRDNTFRFIKTNTNIDLSHKATQMENLKLLFESKQLNALNALGKFIKKVLKLRCPTSDN